MRKESIESLDEIVMSSEERCYSLNDPRSVDAIQGDFNKKNKDQDILHSRLTLELLHDLEEFVVDIDVVGKLHFHSIQIRECVFDVERPHGLGL